MKIWSQLNETQRERAVHFYQHQVIDDFLSDGCSIEAKEEEDKAQVEQIQKCLEHAKTLENYSDQVEACFEDEAVFDLTFSIAIDLAQASYFIEEDESAVNLGEINDCFEDEDDKKSESTESTESNDDQDELAELLPISNKSKKHSLN